MVFYIGNKMIHYFYIFLTAVVTSLYFFPFEFTALPGVNTKMTMAVVGLMLCMYHLIRKKELIIPKELLQLSLIAFGISLMAYFSVVYNDTPDYSYVTYFISMWVWLSAAFVVCMLIKKVHGRISIELLCHYLIVVCVIQCIIALVIDYVPSVKSVVDTYINQDQGFLNEVDRLYGIGAWLDVAGTRFAACLIMIAFLAYKYRFELTRSKLWLYILAYIIITIIGNMIARTTTVGNVISIVFLIFMLKPWKMEIKIQSLKLWVNIIILVSLVVPIIGYLYTTNEQFKSLFQYGFEGFFNYVENGTWETSSTNKLKTMYVFPETFKTWIIGDGYYVNPYRLDPYYVGEKVYFSGYYMLTDVGYLRLIFYFGLIGMSGFIFLFTTITNFLITKSPIHKYLFLMLLLANLIIWLKVSTDIFLVFALLFSVVHIQEKKLSYLQ